jgi:hypothetical protein
MFKHDTMERYAADSLAASLRPKPDPSFGFFTRSASPGTGAVILQFRFPA